MKGFIKHPLYLILFLPYFSLCNFDNMNFDIDNLINNLNDPVKNDDHESTNENKEQLDFSSLFEQFLETNEKCEYKCPNGRKAVMNRHHVPTSNGCGPKELSLDTSRVPEMTECCNSHDICYDTCNSDKTQCDNTFKTCLQNICNKLQAATGIKKEDIQWCDKLADTFYRPQIFSAVILFKNSQSKACSCDESPTDESYHDQKSNTRATKTPLDLQLDDEELTEPEDFDSPLGDAPDLPKENGEDFEKMMRLLREEL